jgi:uracil-DNA glycosylase family 4
LPALAVPAPDCGFCPRLALFRAANRDVHGDWHNAPVPSFGALDARLLIVGLAPGLKGANRTGRPFTGDYAGDLLYATLKTFGYAKGEYAQSPADGLELIDCRITNSVRCVPPENKPTPAEIAACRPFLVEEIAAMPKIDTILALGAVAHQTVLAALGEKRARFPFVHGAVHALAKLRLADSYHCSRYNTNTGRLTPEMFESVFRKIAGLR